MVLNSADGSLTERSNDWQDAVAAQGDWRAVSSDDRQQVEVTNTARGSSVQLSLPQDFRTPGVRYEVTTFAVCNALNDNPPLAAVAMHLQGDPILCIFDAANGSFLRMCDGHSRRISSLSFSEDGELLVSASLDGTLKVWLVEDLDERTVGEVGWLPGLIVADGDDTAEVVRLEDGSDAAAAGIQVGDIIEGAVTDFGLEPFSSAGEFYQFVSQTSPDRSPQLTLRVVRGNDRRDIALPVQQGADMRQPLLSVLLDQSQDAEAEDGTNWLVWTPDGRFDLKGQSLRGRLGWHINTGNDVSPVSYSSVDQYATRFRQQGLLTDLLGAAHSARNEPVTPEMRVSLVAENGQIIEPNYDDELVLRQIRGRLVVDFNEGAGDVIDQAEWTIAGGQALPLTRIDRDMWAVDLEMTDLGRGPHNVVVSMATDEDPPLVLRQSMSLRYQPPAPELTLLAPVRSLTNVDRDALSIRFQADVAVPATVTLQHTADDATVQEVSIPISASGEFEQSVTLNSGANRIRLIAVNDGIPDHLSRFVEEEQTRLELEANYIPAGPPVIRIDQIQDTARQQPLTMIDGQFVTESSELLLQGTIQATIPLSQTAIRHTERTPPQSLEGFAADSTTEFAFRELVTLVPGQQIIELSASAGNESATTTVPVMFRPALPILKLVQPETDRVRERVTADNVDIRFVARVSSDTAFPFTAVVQVDGATVSDPSIQYDANSRTLSGTVSLPADPSRNPDSHVLQIALENEWGARSETGFTAHLLHPPVLSSVQLLRDERSNSADLTCTVDVPPLRPVTQVHVSINDQVLPDLPFETEGVDGPATTIRIPQLPLQPGVNQIVVRLANNDGESAARSIEENVVRPSLPPTVKLAEPLTDLTTMLPSQRLQFKVYSEPGLQRVDVVIRADRRRPQRIALWPRGQESEQNLARTFERRLPLAAGLNEVEIIVQNRGGVVRRRLDLTYLPPPVSLTVDQLVAIDDSWRVEARADEYGAIQFPAAAHDGNAILHGTIGWLPGHRPHGDLWTVRVWVNGFLRSAEIPAPGPAAESARFAVPVVLNQTQNRLRIESPEISFSEERLAMADNSLPRFRQVEVDCEQPERRQRLHLVMMGVEIEDGANVASADELQAFANAALQLEAQSSAFEQVRRYAPLVGESAVGRRLRSLMSLVSGDVARRTGRNQINDVVMFYYRGREHWSDDGQFILEDFQNYENPVQHSQSVSEEYLAELFRDLPGAHVVFLDVQNAERSRLTTSRWPQFPNLGLFRIAWSGRAPNPLPPGPLFSTVRDAIGRVDNEDVLRLRRLESAFHTQLGIDADDDRFRVETYVPEDLADLIVARLTAAAGTPGGNR